MKVDVLPVTDRLIGNTRTMAGLTGDPRLRDHLAEGEQARAAIAELLDAAKAVNEAAYITEHVANADSGCELCRAFGLLEQALAKVSP